MWPVAAKFGVDAHKNEEKCVIRRVYIVLGVLGVYTDIYRYIFRTYVIVSLCVRVNSYYCPDLRRS